MSISPAPEAEAVSPKAVLSELKSLARALARVEQTRRDRLARRYDLAHAARAAGATWPQINAAAGVANMQSHLAGPRPATDA